MIKRQSVITVLTAGVLLAVASCGGGAANLPERNDNPAAGPADANPAFSVDAPESVIGGHYTSADTGQLNIISGLDAAGVAQLAARYRLELVHQHGGQVTLQIAADADMDGMLRVLRKEYAVLSAEPVQTWHTPRSKYVEAARKLPSFSPVDPFYADQFRAPPVTDDIYSFYAGQGLALNTMGFPTAWDVALEPAVAAEPVKIAIIDAGWFDYSTTTRPGLSLGKLDADHCGFVADDGTHTPGLAAATWEVDDDADPATADAPYRNTGEVLLGVIAAALNDYTPQWADFDDPGDNVQADEIWNEGSAGVNPNAEFALIKIGAESGGVWTFNDNNIAEAIAFAAADGADTNGGLWPNGGADADIILLGMFANGAVAANVSTAILTARDSNVLVIAPAGDVVASFDGSVFTDTPVDITVLEVTPASDSNCVAVMATGYNTIGPLPDVTVPAVGDLANEATGWYPRFNPPFHSPYYQLANFSNSGGDIAAGGFGIGFSTHPFFFAGDGTLGDPAVVYPGENYRTSNLNFGSVYAAAYVAGTASIVFQALSAVNGTPPTDDQVLSELTSTVQWLGLDSTAPGVGLLNAGMACATASQGGTLHTIEDLAFGPVSFSQQLTGVQRNTPLTINAAVMNGTAPYVMTVDWGNGDVPDVINTWTNGTPVALAAGYELLGPTALSISVIDDLGQQVGYGVELNVIAPLMATISIYNLVSGERADPGALSSTATYRFQAEPVNLFTGLVEGTPNVTSFDWDFDGDGTPELSGDTVDFSFGIEDAYTVILTATEDARPDSTWSLEVTVGS